MRSTATRGTSSRGFRKRKCGRGSKVTASPTPPRVVDVAQDRGWLADGWTDTVRALAQLVIGVNAFGSNIEENYTPLEPRRSRDRSRDLDRTRCRRRRRPPLNRDDAQADELKPATHAPPQPGTRRRRRTIGAKHAESIPGYPNRPPTPLKSSRRILLWCSRMQASTTGQRDAAEPTDRLRGTSPI